MKSHMRVWRFYRWVGLVAGSFLDLVGGWGAYASLRAALYNDQSTISVPEAIVAVVSLTVFMVGFLLLAYVISQWDCNLRESIMVKLLEVNENSSTKRAPSKSE